MKCEKDKITYGFILNIKTDDKKSELTGSLKLEIIFKKSHILSVLIIKMK